MLSEGCHYVLQMQKLWMLLCTLCVIKGDIPPVCYDMSHTHAISQNLRQCYGINMIRIPDTAEPESILQGPLYQLGNFDDCVYRKKNQYCLAKIQFYPGSNPSPFWFQLENLTTIRTCFHRDNIFLGLCIPESSSAEEAEVAAYHMLQPAAEALGIHAVVNVEQKNCQSRTPAPVTSADIIVGGIVLTITALIIYGTLYDAGFIKGKQNKRDENTAQEFLLCFSLIANCKRLFAVRNSEVLACIQGIRSILTCLEITVHSMYFTIISATTNLEWFEKHYDSSSALLFIDCPIHMVTYLCIGGFLLGYTTKHKLKGKRFTFFQFIHMIVHRFLRLSPTSILLSILSATWLNHLSSGPLWPLIIGTEVKNCKHHWWINLLYVNNYVYADRPCLLHSWYLATDFQNYIMSLFILMLANIYQTWVVAIYGFVLVFWIAVPFIQTYIDSLDAALFFLPETIRNLPTNEMYLKNYITFHYNIAPYFVGVIFGCVFYHIKVQQKRISKGLRAVSWIVSLTVSWSILLINHTFYQSNYEYNVITASAYAALQKTVFAVGIGSILLGCCAGWGSICNRFLSWPLFQIFGSLTYCIYLVHFILQRISSGSIREPVTCDLYYVVTKVATDFLTAVIAGTILCLFVEMPMSNIFQLKIHSGYEKHKNEKSNSFINCKPSNGFLKGN